MSNGLFEACQACEDGRHDEHAIRNVNQHGTNIGREVHCVCIHDPSGEERDVHAGKMRG